MSLLSGPTPGPSGSGTGTGSGSGSGPGQGTGITVTAVQAAINAAIAALPQEQNNRKNYYKLPDQANFSGQAENIDSFLLECTMRFRVLLDDFNTTDKKVFYALFDERRSCSYLERAILPKLRKSATSHSSRSMG